MAGSDDATKNDDSNEGRREGEDALDFDTDDDFDFEALPSERGSARGLPDKPTWEPLLDWDLPSEPGRGSARSRPSGREPSDRAAPSSSARGNKPPRSRPDGKPALGPPPRRPQTSSLVLVAQSLAARVGMTTRALVELARPRWRSRSGMRPLLQAGVAVCVGVLVALLMWLGSPSRGALPVVLEPLALPIAAPVRQGIIVKSEQQAVVVEIDGVVRGTAPLEILDLSPGKHVIRFSGPGAATVDKTIELTRGQVVDLGNVVLPRAAARLVLELEPADAFAWIKKKGARRRVRYGGPWPRTIELDKGTYEIAAALKGHVAARDFVTFDDLVTKTLRIQLKPDGDIYE